MGVFCEILGIDRLWTKEKLIKVCKVMVRLGLAACW